MCHEGVDTPLDCVEWNIDNTKREDIELVREPIVSEINTSRLLPPSERDVMARNICWGGSWDTPESEALPHVKFEGNLIDVAK